jgi:diamine N-acetyltransferase
VAKNPNHKVHEEAQGSQRLLLMDLEYFFMSDIKIRKANHLDVDLLINLGIKTFRDTFEAVNTPGDMKLYLDKNFNDERIGREIGEEGSVFFLAFDGDDAVGFARVRRGENQSGLNAQNFLEIERLYAVKEHHGKQVGKVLMQTCLDYSKQQGCDTVWLGVWEHNPRAIAFYEKWGFEKFGAHDFLLGTDLQTDILMKKKLN